VSGHVISLQFKQGYCCALAESATIALFELQGPQRHMAQ
jgi:hypothetical protein